MTNQEIAQEFINNPASRIRFKEMDCMCMETMQPIVSLEATAFYEDRDFAWIERCDIYTEHKAAKVNHFGVSKDFLGLGVGRAFIEESLGYMREKHDLNTFKFNVKVESDRGRFLITIGGNQTGQVNSKGYAEFTI